MDPVQVFRLLRRRWRLIAALGLLGGILGAGSGVLAEENTVAPAPEIEAYEATHTLIVDLSASNEQTADLRNLPQLAQRMVLGEIPVSVANQLGRSDPVALAASVKITVRGDIQSLEVSAVDLTSEGAVEVADGFAAEVVRVLQLQLEDRYVAAVDAATETLDDIDASIFDLETRLGDTVFDPDIPDDDKVVLVEGLQAEIDALQTQRAPALVAVASAERSLENAPDVALATLAAAVPRRISERAYDARLRAGALGNNVEFGFAPQSSNNNNDSVGSGDGGGSPIPNSPLVRGIIGAILGLGLAGAVIVAIERLDPRVRTKEDLEELTDLPVVAEVPALDRSQRRGTEVLSHSVPRSRTAESYRVLRSSLDYAEAILHNRGEAESEGAVVVLVTSPGPSEGKTTTVANLAAVLAERDRDVLVINCDFRRPRLHHYLGGHDDAQKVNPTTIPGVNLITHVTTHDPGQNPAEVVRAQAKVIERARARFDYIVLDTAPLLTTNDATDVLESADHVLLVAQAGRTTAEAIDRAAELLERRGAPVLGLVLVGARDTPGARGYYYDGDDPYLAPTKERRGRRQNRSADQESETAKPAKAPERSKSSKESLSPEELGDDQDGLELENATGPPVPLVAADPGRRERRAARRMAKADKQADKRAAKQLSQAGKRRKTGKASRRGAAEKAAEPTGEKAAGTQRKPRVRSNRPERPQLGSSEPPRRFRRAAEAEPIKSESADEPAAWGWPDRP